METAASKLGLPPGFRFMPTDEEVVVHYLLRRIQNQRLPVGDILDDDPLSAPPWILLAKHGRKEDAFFFAEGQPMNGKGSRQKRICAGGGTWEGQGQRKAAKGREGEKLSVHVDGEEIEWRKYALNFEGERIKGSTGWVMHEYSIIAPPELAASPVRVYRIRFSGHGKNAQKRKRNEIDWGSEEEEEVHHGAARAAARPEVAEPDAPLFVGGCATEPHPKPVNYLPVPVVAGSDALFVGGCPESEWTGAGAGGALSAATSSLAQDLPALVDSGYPSAPQPEPVSYLPVPVVAGSDAQFVGGCPSAPQLGPVDAGNGNLAEWMGSGADGALSAATSSLAQDLPALVNGGGEDWDMFSLDDLMPSFRFSGAAGAGDMSAPMVPAV